MMPYSDIERKALAYLFALDTVCFEHIRDQGNDEYVIDDPAITIEKYGYTIDFNRIAEIRFTRETETYLGGLDSDGHERKDNFGVSEEDTSFYLSDGYLMKYETDYGDYPATKEQAIDEIEKLIHKALTTPDMSIRITDREGNISCPPAPDCCNKYGGRHAE